MSFSSEIKNELCRQPADDRELMMSELYGMMLFGREFRENGITFTTENQCAAKRFSFLAETLFMPIIEKQTALRTKTSHSRLYKIKIIDSNDCKRIFETYGHGGRQVTLRVNRANLSTDSCTAAFVRGAYLSCGSVTDPMKSYHAEFSVPYKNLSADLCKLLKEVTESSFTPKTVTRSGSYIVYFKGSEQICDLLTYMGAPINAMEVMGTKAIKQVRNNVNRQINGELANIGKIASAAARQLEAIEYIKRTKGLESLPDELKQIALLRVENPDMSLRDLGQHLSPPISRSGANHRMQRLLELAEETEDRKLK